jgi:hypothetical protein
LDVAVILILSLMDVAFDRVSSDVGCRRHDVPSSELEWARPSGYSHHKRDARISCE